MQWLDLFTHWTLIESDLHQFYGIDIESGVLQSRSYRWLIVRVSGLFSIENSRLRNKIYPPDKTQKNASSRKRR